MTRIALIDADIAAYRAASARVRGVSWGYTTGDVPDGVLDPSQAADAAIQTIDAWTRLAGCSRAICAFTGRENWRKRILPSYKANRAGKVKPQCYSYVVNAITDHFETRLVDGLEGDDILGIMATSPKYHNAVVVSVDKDMRTIPGWHINPLKEDVPVLVGLDEADYKWLTQTLTGDTSDGYVGIPKCGPVKAAFILGPNPGLSKYHWPRVVAAYRAAGLTEDDALVQARVARILRREDYDKATKEILCWHPTTPLRIPLLASQAAS